MRGGKTRTRKGDSPFTIAEVIRRAMEQGARITFVFTTGTSAPLEECLKEVKQH
jgi:hypothetical protein